MKTNVTPSSRFEKYVGLNRVKQLHNNLARLNGKYDPDIDRLVPHFTLLGVRDFSTYISFGYYYCLT
jgi:hypothetical protein